jgi:hypothetical protein
LNRDYNNLVAFTPPPQTGKSIGRVSHKKQGEMVMSSLAISGIIFGCVFGGTLLGMVLRAVLPEQHLSTESKDVVKLGMGLIGTLTALVLGLLVASAKSTFDTQRSGVAQVAANIILLDRALAHFGPEAKDAREMLRASVTDLLAQTWPAEYSPTSRADGETRTEGKYEGLFEKIQALVPKNDMQRATQAQALKTALDLAQMRWTLFAQKGSSIPVPFLGVMVAWLMLLFASFSLFAPPNPTVVATLLICALAVSSAVFLILELDHPFAGLIQISSDPLRNALELIGR